MGASALPIGVDESSTDMRREALLSSPQVVVPSKLAVDDRLHHYVSGSSLALSRTVL
jgi:hypothetical protein